MAGVDLIVPVYGGLADLQICLRSLVSYPQQSAHRIVVIDDASPDPQVRVWLRRFAADHDAVELLHNERNLGFVATVNRGMGLSVTADVVLVNSDTRVAGDWLDRLRRCALSAADVGTVTPFSNNATICSYPEFCKDNPLPDGVGVEELDALFAACNPGHSVEIPTAVGFCMYIRRACLNQIGLFDENRFGRGYGEENDFCMRATRQGWRHLLCADTFVFHRGGVSFGAEKQERERVALATLNGLYPDYTARIGRHLTQDPAAPHRLSVSIALARDRQVQKVLFVTHNMGGGTQTHIRDLSSMPGVALQALLLRPSGHGTHVLSLGWQEGAPGLSFRLPADSELLLRCCRYLGVDRVHFHHTMGVDPWLWLLAERLQVPLDVTLHDYYLINGNPTLIDRQARFCEEPSGRDRRCAEAYPLPGGVSAEQWRQAQRVLLDRAGRVFVPSEYAAALYRQYFDDLNIVVASHPDSERDAPYPVPKTRAADTDAGLRIVVLGALSREKGADLLEQTAQLCDRENIDCQFVLLGYAYRPLDPVVKQTGAYQESELDTLLAAEDPDLVWFPALWPETYSYTLSAALRLGRPIAAPDIGAFPERLLGRPLTWVESWKWRSDEWAVFFERLTDRLADPASGTGDWQHTPRTGQGFRYRAAYLQPRQPGRQIAGADEALLRELIAHRASSTETGHQLTNREKLLRRLVRARQSRLVAAAVRLVPFPLQRRLKRMLSSRPIHEIISD